MSSKRHKNSDSRLEILEAVVNGELDTTGYSVRYKNGNEIGVVKDMIDMGYQQQLVVTEELNVSLQRSRKPLKGKQHEEDHTDSVTATHHIPLVSDLVQNVDPARQLITLQLPRGLIQLGRQDAYCRVLAEEIPQYTEQLTNRFRDRVLGEREFPSLQKLRDAGRSDLVELVKKAGGLATVASYIGLRSPRKPHGYFEDVQVLDWELSCFIASGWVHMPSMMVPLLTADHLAVVSTPHVQGQADSLDNPGQEEGAREPFAQAVGESVDYDGAEGGYFFNTITDQVSVDEPEIPQLVESEEGVLIIEDEQQRFMPLQSSLHVAGRHDLATAVKQHGGFRTVAEMLDRKLLYQWTNTETDGRRLRAAVHACQRAARLPAHAMPSRTQLEEAGMSHVVRWVVVAGGFEEVATQLSMKSSRARKQVTPEQLAPDLEAFTAKHMSPERRHLVPSLRELRAAGFHELARRLRRCEDKQKIADIMGKELPVRGGLPGQKRTRRKKPLSQLNSLQSGSSKKQEGLKKSLNGDGATEHMHAGQQLERATIAQGVHGRSKCGHSFGSAGLLGKGWPQARAQASHMHVAHARLAWRSRWFPVATPRRRRVQSMYRWFGWECSRVHIALF